LIEQILVDQRDLYRKHSILVAELISQFVVMDENGFKNVVELFLD